MKARFSFLFFLSLLLLVSQTSYSATNPEALARKAVSEDPKESAAAVAELRAMGPFGLNVLLKTYADEINRQIANPVMASTPRWRRISAALDEVAQQKDSYLSGLYWYTDFGQAKAAAGAAGKPILSLRLLGKLNEEFSCANSRFFRTILYSNEEVARTLREKFILHWQSVRPAPRVTIDFGDGRRLERTLTGNSIHYILDQDGRPLDALPGLYGPAAFLREVTAIDGLFQQLSKKENGNLIQTLLLYQRQRLNRVNLNWLADIEKIGGKIPEGFVVTKREDGTPEALQIASLAFTKMVTEASILRSMTSSAEALGVVTDEAAWKKIALAHIADAELDAHSIGLIQRQTQKAFRAEAAERNSDKTLARLVEKLQTNIAMDTVRNEYLLHTKLYAWLVADRSRSDLDALNKKVYAELFLTPASDPWLGLYSPETYVALEGGGVVR